MTSKRNTAVKTTVSLSIVRIIPMLFLPSLIRFNTNALLSAGNAPQITFHGLHFGHANYIAIRLVYITIVKPILLLYMYGILRKK